MQSQLTELLTAAVSELSQLRQNLEHMQSRIERLETLVADLDGSKPTRAANGAPADTAPAALATAESTTASSFQSAQSGTSATAGQTGTAAAPPSSAAAEPAREPAPEEPYEPVDLSRLKFGGPSSLDDEDLSSSRRPFVKWLPTDDAELPMIDARCRLKAEACRWADQRRKLLAKSADFRIEIEPRDRELIWQAKQLPDCFLWMSHSTAPNPTDANAWLMLAGCFDALSQAVTLIQRVLEDLDGQSSDPFEKAVDLLAEAQSALRVAVARIDGPTTDHDQARVFGWLKHVASERQIFIRRFMRLDDPAAPENWSDLLERLRTFEQNWESGRTKKTNRKKLLGKLRYKLEHLPTDDDAAVLASWKSIADDVEVLIADGLPPSNIELRDLLIRSVDQLPEMASMPKGFQLTIREIDRYLSLEPHTDDCDHDEPVDRVAPQVLEAANMLAGKAVVIIGGDRRPHAQEAIERAFLLSELVWIDTRAHESVAGFEPYIARPEVAMVLLAIRWSSHSYGEVQDFCRTYGKPLVRLPGGYNPNQIAAQILEQCSQRLSDAM